jgi:hypothetical protein
MTSIDNQSLSDICKHIAKAHLALLNPNLTQAQRSGIQDTLNELNELRISLLEAKHS